MESKSKWNSKNAEEIVRWLTIAIEDRASAYSVFKHGIMRNAVYCLQQASEKLLKAFLVANNARVDKTHNIGYLLLDSVWFDVALAKFNRMGVGAERMTAFATEYCYPNQDKKDFLDVEEVIGATEFADAIYEHLEPFFGEEVLGMALQYAVVDQNPFKQNHQREEGNLYHATLPMPRGG